MRAPLALSALLCLALTASGQQNVLVIVADDIGVDRVGAYAEHPDPGHTPVIDQLAAAGVMFRNAWANPICTTSRATILTGRYGFRTGVGGGPPDHLDPPWLKNDEVTLAEALSATHHTWALGKWHLDEDVEPFTNPMDQGFDLHYGTTGNIKQWANETYVDWTKTVDGIWQNETTYATTDTVDDALALIGAADGPWFCYMALHAPHGPVHKPPAGLHSFSLPPNVNANIPIHVKAMIEAMDTELGRLFASIDPAVLANTLIVFIGDNGTTQAATTAPFPSDHAKGTIFEGGINVPLIIAGPGVAQGAVCDGLVNSTDLFATVCETVGVPHPTADDSVSLVPYFSQPNLPSIRPWAYAEYFAPDTLELKPVWDQAVRDGRYKVVRRWLQDTIPFMPRFVEFYDLQSDPYEQTDLTLAPPLTPQQQASFDALNAAADELLGPWLNFGDGLTGAYGEPFLEGGGPFESAETFTITLSNALEGATLGLLLGFDTLDLPFKGGVLVPDFTAPGALLIAATDASGGLALSAPMPPGTPPGIHIWFQYWIQDPAGPVGWSASNAVAGTTD